MPSLFLPRDPCFHPLQMSRELLPSLHAQPRRCHGFNSIRASGGSSQSSFLAVLSQLQHTSAIAGASRGPHPNQGPLAPGTARRHAKTWFPASEKFPPQKRELQSKTQLQMALGASGGQALRISRHLGLGRSEYIFAAM